MRRHEFSPEKKKTKIGSVSATKSSRNTRVCEDAAAENCEQQRRQKQQQTTGEQHSDRLEMTVHNGTYVSCVARGCVKIFQRRDYQL
jgi:hypothetical protein